MGNRHSAVLGQQKLRHRFAHDVGATDNHRMQAGKIAKLFAQQDSASCPECWIDWQVIDAAGQEVNPMRKQFYNLCQQSFWLAMQAGGEDETSDRIAQITDNHP